MPATATRLKAFTESVIRDMTRVALKHDAINLSQGFPDFDPPEVLIAAARQALDGPYHQYAITWGAPRLRQALAHKQRHWTGLDIDADAHIVVTCGSTEAMAVAMMTVCNPGDKVIIFSLFYESYTADTVLCGAEPVYVHLQPPTFEFDPAALRRAFETGARALILCNPANPTGKVYTRQELQLIADLAQEFDAFVITDEVYEHIVYAPYQHVYMASLPGMFERTITVSSAGKTFGLTGWKIGWICANEKVSRACRLVHQYVTFSVSTPMQEAVAEGLKRLPEYLPEFVSLYQGKRDYFYSELSKLGFNFPLPMGTYFMMVPIRGKTQMKDVDFAFKLIEERKVATVPPSAFYLKSTEGEGYLRFCFAKKEETLKSAAQNLKGL